MGHFSYFSYKLVPVLTKVEMSTKMCTQLTPVQKESDDDCLLHSRYISNGSNEFKCSTHITFRFNEVV